ncbi:RDD family protein [Luteococcus sp. Sow4_B9]|uniref:RDD family protein n=1 Tax=Luteococcus sp. Sow4_B9 TaxID=3438792 RepID=UPI003F9B299B
MTDSPKNPDTNPWNPQGEPPSNPYASSGESTGPQFDAPQQPTANPYAEATPGTYGQPPANQNSYQQGQYDQSPGGQSPYGQNPYGQNPFEANAAQTRYGHADYGQYPYQQGPTKNLTGWFRRVLGYLIDTIPTGILAGIGSVSLPRTDEVTGEVISAGNPVIVAIFFLAAFAFNFWNRWYRAGKTGKSIGRQVMNNRLVAEATGEPIGVGKAFLRDIVHTLDEVICNLGYLFPIWDSKRQTFADKIMKTVVVDD